MTSPSYNIDEVLTQDAHLIHSFADLFKIKQDGGPTVIASAKGAYVRNTEGEEFLDEKGCGHG